MFLSRELWLRSHRKEIGTSSGLRRHTQTFKRFISPEQSGTTFARARSISARDHGNVVSTGGKPLVMVGWKQAIVTSG